MSRGSSDCRRSPPERASRSYEQIRSHDNLNSDQLGAKIASKQEDLRALRHKNSDLANFLSIARERLSEWKDVFHFIGQNPTQIPALHRLLANAEKEGWSAKRILEHSQLAKAGKYTARNYSQYEIDLAQCFAREIHWKHNFQQHLEERHPEWKKLIPADLVDSLHISLDEQLALKIPPQEAIE
ncbi:hypothetical protein B0H19DRAFT_1079567 [Mycena capillaripes]|nr:hypothetical protein B0H19DRAFT_1079567 [Mycena capillaripes]